MVASRVARSPATFIVGCSSSLRGSYCSQPFKSGRYKAVLPKIGTFCDLLKTDQELQNEMSEAVLHLCEQREILLNDIEELSQLSETEDPDLRMLKHAEHTAYTDKLIDLEIRILEELASAVSTPRHTSILMEVTAGVGGKEAMLFAKALFEMYIKYMSYKGWDYSIAEIDNGPLGGIRHASVLVEGLEAAFCLEGEGGVHRIQRVPSTERAGRIHTSTATVAVLPQPSEIEVPLSDSDLEITTKRSSGAGGQHVNTTDSAVRILHIPTGITVESQTDRSQIKNKELALKRLRAKIFEMKMAEQNRALQKSRKTQVGSGGRSEKVRTINFPQDRITDHRLSKSFHGIAPFFEGEKLLDKIIEELQSHLYEEKLAIYITELFKAVKMK